MKNPFKKLDILLSLSFRDLVILQKVLTSTLPDSNAEGTIIYLHTQISNKIEEIEQSDSNEN